MSVLKKPTQASIFIDYVPAELRENKRWEVTYYVKNPFSKKLIRKANRVKPMKSVTDRRKLGRQMVKNINKELEQGWNPYRTEENSAIFKVLIPEMDHFIARKNQEFKKNNLRKDTLRSYTSFVNMIKKYARENNHHDITIYDFDTYYINEYLDNLYYEKENSARTRNNHLSFISTLFTYFRSRKFIGHNPVENIKSIKIIKKEKHIIPKGVRSEIVNYLGKNNPNYLTLCLACYYCLIRRTELTKIKVSDVILRQGIIYITNANSKTKKSKPVTIPNNFIPYLVNHLKKANNRDYLFSTNNYLPGPLQLNPKRISDDWAKMRKETKIPDHYVWYHLKDTGITELLLNGVPSIEVRDQARHYSIVQTEEYTPKEIMKAVGNIQKNIKEF